MNDDTERLAQLGADELRSWENRGIPTAHRVSDRAEANADEQQDVVTSLNFPLHWTSIGLTWPYLFDIAIAGEMLAARPDDRVLDLAAGTCWASETLTRLGVRTVAIDLSWEMLRRGRERLWADSRLTLRSQAAFVTARGQALPFADQSFDGVLCLNALHHHPSYLDVLREIHRVLKFSGRAVFSEPGSAHADEPLSQFRMREEGILEKPVSLPLVRRLAFESGFSRMEVVPLRSPETYAFEYTGTSQDDEHLRRMWTDTLRHASREHARFILHKGEAAPADSLLPAAHLSGRLRAEIIVPAESQRIQQGQSFAVRLLVVNTGTVIWRARGRRFGGQVTCGLKICRTDGEVLREDLGRTPISRDVAPGEQVELVATVSTESTELPPGAYELKYDMVVEGVTWFEFHGSPCPRRQLHIDA